METSVVDFQRCYQSQGCPLITNTAVEAKVVGRLSTSVVEAIIVRSKGFGKGKKRRQCHTAEHFPGDAFSFQAPVLL